MAIQPITKVKKLKGARVLLRVDFNVPLKQGKVADDSRLVASLPTISYLQKKGARIILLSHLGRPDGKRVPSLSLRPVAYALESLLGKRVNFISEVSGKKVSAAVEALEDGQILLLENLRFSPHEQGNKGTFAKELSRLGDMYVLDGFAVAHRGDASVSGLPKYLSSFAGHLLTQEIDGLTRIVKRPTTPFVVVLGGAKMETKIPVMQALLPKAGYMLVGGGITNTMLHARGYGVGQSLVDKDHLKEALAYSAKKKVIMPIDVVVGKKFSHAPRVVTLEKKPHVICKKGEAIFDIGPATIRLYASYIKRAKTLVWNGAMGVFEQRAYATGTFSVARLIAAQSKGRAFGVIGGGETVQAMDAVGMSHDIDLVSTGGGAMLEFLAGEKLPGIEALKKK